MPEILRCWTFFAAPTNHSHWTWLLARVWLAINELRLYFKVLVYSMVSGLPRRDSSAASTEKASAVGMGSRIIGIEWVACGLGVGVVVFLEVLLAVSSGPS